MVFSLTNIIKDLVNIFYPKICAACAETLMKNENILCTKCRYELPRTNFHTDQENEVARIFWGRVHIEYATAYFLFQKGGRVQKLMHKLKYRGEKEVGIELGRIIGRELRLTPFNQIDLIVPVPLHKSKKYKRGYNQSELIAEGIGEAMNKPVNTSTLYRNVANPTQTRKHRYDRWTNVEDIFIIKDTEALRNKHILLIDDIITTGATLEACASALLKAPEAKVSIVAVAKA